ncbi:MAG: hypothetical protein HOV67_10555 [Kribbellaceae bacterium]|nr:hypothetical protein [Kribbellaceae bacterium]
MSESENRARNSLLELAAQLIVVSTSLEGTLAERLSDHFPWMLAAKAWRLATETIGLPAQLDEFAIPTIGLAAVTRNIHLVRPHAGISSAR